MTQIDTPDYQQGVVSAQKLLATVAPGDRSVNIGIPPNTETLVVLYKFALEPVSVGARGLTTGVEYTGTKPLYNAVANAWETVYIDVTSVLDREVEIHVGVESDTEWYVYSDAGVHIVMDAQLAEAIGVANATRPLAALLVAGTDETYIRPLRTSSQGAQYVIPTAPATDTADHPPVELKQAGGSATGVVTVVAAPGVGHRLRLFALQLASSSASAFGLMERSVAGGCLMAVGPGGTGSIEFYPSGLALAEGEGVNVHTSSTPECFYSVVYTSEAI